MTEWPRSSHHPSHTNWRKSSHSGGEGGQRVELAGLGRGVGVRDSNEPDDPILHITRQALATAMSNHTAAWCKSSHSGNEGGQRVELADLGPGIAIRDSKDPNGPILHVTRQVLATAIKLQ